MTYVRLTLLKPRPGSEREVRRLLLELDDNLSQAPGQLFSVLLAEGDDQLGRISVWQSKEDANREALSQKTLSLRSRLRYHSLETEERLLEGHWASAMRLPYAIAPASALVRAGL
jgi:hypothetical protein